MFRPLSARHELSSPRRWAWLVRWRRAPSHKALLFAIAAAMLTTVAIGDYPSSAALNEADKNALRWCTLKTYRVETSASDVRGRWRIHFLPSGSRPPHRAGAFTGLFGEMALSACRGRCS